MVEANPKVMPSWIYDGIPRPRRSCLLRVRARTMRYVVGILAGLNRVYIAPEKLKRVGRSSGGWS
jgi:hypothetical protein